MRTPIVNSVTNSVACGVTALALLVCIGNPSAAQTPTPHRDGRTTRAEGKPVANISAKRVSNRESVPSTPITPQGDSLSKKADANRIDGSASAKVWVVEISDMECPYCKRWHEQVFPKVRDEFIKTGKIRFAYINFPLNQHRHAFSAATAAMCAGVQGKFWPMHDALFNSQNDWGRLSSSEDFFKGLAGKVGVNVPLWESCLTAPSIKALIEADRDRARGIHVESTPSFLIANKLIDGAMPWDEMKKAINDALATTGTK